MSQIGNIIEGHLNELLGRGIALKEARIQVCEMCPIHKDSGLGLICDSSKWINSINEVRTEATPGFTRGCGCRMSAKTTIEGQHCVVGKW